MKRIRSMAMTALLFAALGLSGVLMLMRICKYESGKAEYCLLRESLSLPSEILSAASSDTSQEQPSMPENPSDVWTKRLSSRNPDYVYWLWIPGTNINYPVVKSPVPGYYLNHTFSGKENPCGTIFCLEAEEGAAEDNVILYGHNMKDGSMFADLKKYTDEEFRSSHPEIWIYRQEEWQRFTVFSCRIIGGDDESVYRSYFEGDDEKREYIDKMKENSLYPTEIRPQISDSLLTLSTCYGKDKRVIVQAVLLCYTE